MHREQFLRTLETELCPHLSPGELSERLAEVSAHLDDGIAARLELGLTYSEAEKDTVTAFGEARSVAQAVVQPLFRASVGVRRRWLGASYAFLAVCYGLLDWLVERVPFVAPLMLAFLVAFALRVAIASFRSRTAASVQMLTTGLAAGVFFWVFFGVTWLNLWHYGGMGCMPRWGDYDLLYRTQPEPFRAALSDPIGNWVSQAGTGFSLGMGLAAAFGAVDMIAAWLGRAHASLQRRPEIA